MYQLNESHGQLQIAWAVLILDALVYKDVNEMIIDVIK